MSDFYETDRAVSEYLLFHYGSADEVLPYGDGPVAALDYPARCVSVFAYTIQYAPSMRALDLGCAVGRSTFELARNCGEVMGIDYSERFIAAATQLKQASEIPYTFLDHGDIWRSAVARPPAGVDTGRVQFEQGDAMFLREGLGQFDVILMANLIDRLVDPSQCLERLAELVTAGGYVILTSPYTWLEEYTPKEHWIGGREIEGQEVSTTEALKSKLAGKFELVQQADLPFLIREHKRKFQWSVAEGTLWRRISEE